MRYVTTVTDRIYFGTLFDRPIDFSRARVIH